MATALKLRTDIKKLKDALKVKKIPANIKSKLESQLKKSQDELAALKKGKKTPPSKSAVKGTQTALSRLKSLIKKPKYGVYADGQTKDLEEDAVQGAFPKGRRVSKGLKSNQFGSAKENKGKVYYEYRSNRLDVKQPKKRQTYPKLEKGGYMADGGSVKKKIADGGMMAKGGKVNKVDNRDLIDKANTYEQKEVIKDLIPILNKNGIKLRYGTSLGKSPQAILFDYKHQDGILYIPRNGWSGSVTYMKEEISDASDLDYLIKNPPQDGDDDYASGGMMAKGGNVTKEFKKGDKVKIDMGYGKGVEEVTVMSDLKAGISGIQFVTLKPKHGAPYTITYSKLKKVIKLASGGYMAKGGKLSLSEFAERYDDNEDNNMHSENVVLLAENFGTKQDILDAKTILAKHQAIGSLPYYLMQERDALSKRLYAKYQEAAKKKEADGGMMADGGVVSKEEFLDDIYDMAGSVQVVEQNDGVQLSTDNRVALMPFIQKYSPFGKSGYGSVSKIDEVDMDGEKYYYMTIGYPKFEKGGVMADGGSTNLDKSIYIDGVGLVKEKVVTRLNEDGVSETYVIYEPVSGADKKLKMANGGEIKKGDMVKVDNPYWHAAMGTDKPVVRKVTMVAGEDVFFKDGSTSSMKYVTKMEAGGVMAES